MNKINRRVIVMVCCLAAVLAIVGLFMFRPPNTTHFSSDKVAFDYPRDYTNAAVTPPQAGQRATYLVKLNAAKPVRSIQLAKEVGAIKGANFMHSNFLDFLESNTKKSLPVNFKNYENQGLERIKVSNRDVSLVSYKYLGADNKTTMYAKLFIMPIDNDGYYLTIQSTDQNTLNSESRALQTSLQIL